MKKFLYLLSTVVITFSCSKPDETPLLPVKTIEVNPRQIYYDKTTAYEISNGSTVFDPTNYTWTSSDTHVGVIDNKGIFTAKHVGLTKITAQNTAQGVVLESQVFVKPYNSLYREPLVKYNASSADILNYETRAKYASDATSLIFVGEAQRIDYVLYALKDDKNVSVGVTMPNTSAKLKEMNQFLTERYTATGYESNIYMFTNNTTTDVGLTTDSKLGIVAIYIPRKTGGRLGTAELVNQVKQMIR